MTETDSLNLPDDVKETLSEKEIENTQDYVDNYQLENLFMNQLKSENIVASNQMLNHLIKINQSKLAKNELQEKKYRLVSLITVITRAAIKQGCTPNLAYRLSDQLIQKMDAIEHSREFSTFLKSLILEFSVLLQTRGTKYNSEVVNTAIEYISRNLYQPISNEDIANYVGVNTNYLSSIFKKETNIALHQYLLEARVNEAQYLLSHTDIAFKDISEILQFSNQSHFGKIFKSKTMYTPKEFRILF